MSLPAFGVKRPVVANLVMLAIIGAGVIFGVSLRREFFPEIDPDRIVINAPYPGAAPEEVQDALAVKIEDAVKDLDGVKEITSVVSEGAATITIEFEDGEDIDAATADVKREVDALQDLPEDADRIIVTKLEPNLPTIVLSLFGGPDERLMKDSIRRIRADLESLPGMGQVVLSGARRDEIVVEVRPEAVLEHRLSLPAVSQRINEAMRELPGGSVRSSTQNVSVRSLGVDEVATDVREIVVKADAQGQRVTLGSIAEVSDGFADVDVRQRVNGENSVSLTIYKVGEEDAVSMAELVKAYVAGRQGKDFVPTTLERFKGLLKPPGADGPVSDRERAYRLGLSRETPPPGELILTTDLARFIVGRLELLTRNAAMGGVLVFVTLLLLLNWRVSFWVAAGLVISLMGTLAVMHFAGVTLNLLTMFGLIIVLGILVDDAIVVAENITARHEQGLDNVEAGIKGANQVAWPVVATVMTTIVAFLPLSMIGGRIGDMLAALPVVVICALSVSLVECLLILPSHMAESLKKNDERADAGFLARVEAKYDRARDGLFTKIIIPGYGHVIEKLLKHRYLAVVGAIALVIISLGMPLGGRLKFEFLGSADAETVNVELRMPVGTPASVTDRFVERIELAALEQDEVQSIFAQTGAIGSLEGEGESVSPHLGQVILELKPVEQRELPADQVILAIRDRLGELPGVKSLSFQEAQGGPGGAPINLAVTGDDPDLLIRLADEMKGILAQYPGVFDIADNADRGQPELRIELREGASELGFTTASLAQQVRGAVLGLESFTFAGDREDVDVRVIYPEHVRRSLAAVETMYVIAPNGEPVPLSEVARVYEASGYATVRRLDGHRSIEVRADVDKNVANAQEVLSTVMPEFRELVGQYPGVRIVPRGQQQNLAESFASLPVGMLTAVGLIYVILAWLFQSYTQPLAVLSAVPFAVIGVVWGHLLLGSELTILSMIGFIALSGIVVNDSLIYMEFFNEQRRAGVPVLEACANAGRARVRAILLTTITTVLGLLPLMLEQSFQARFLIPMAITISFGLMSATAIILIVLPCFLVMLDDAKRVWTTLWTGRVARVEPSGAQSLGEA
ncbi:MAG: efflux RND transporter permease subunit [Planctomycetota bacterium]